MSKPERQAQARDTRRDDVGDITERRARLEVCRGRRRRVQHVEDVEVKSSRRPPPSEKSLPARRFTMFCAESLRLPYGSTRIVVLPFCVMAGPPSGSACRKM